MPVAQRIQSLDEVAASVIAGHEFSYALRDFLDGFYAEPRESAFRAEPPRLSSTVPDGPRLDAYLAAVAEHMCREQRFRVPNWTAEPHRFLEMPWFGMNSHAGRMLLLMDSPFAFRARNIFVSADALKRV